MDDPRVQINRGMRRQHEYVETWRARYPERVRGHSWQCPLCNTVVQPYGNDPDQISVTYHQMEHGRDWRDYAAIGVSVARQPRTAPDVEVGE